MKKDGGKKTRKEGDLYCKEEIKRRARRKGRRAEN